MNGCNSAGGISLFCVPRKVYRRVLNDRKMEITNESLSDQQRSFRKRKGCVDQIFTPKILVEEYLEKDRELSAAFMNLERHLKKNDGESL